MYSTWRPDIAFQDSFFPQVVIITVDLFKVWEFPYQWIG